MKKTLQSYQLIWMLPLGFASGLPLALTSTTLQAWFTQAGINVMTIAWLNVAASAYVFKFIWAPLFDRLTPPIGPFRRGWMQIFLFLLSAVVAIISLFEPSIAVLKMAILASIIAFFSASLDIVVDAYRTEKVAEFDRGLATAAFVTAYRIAMLASGGLMLILADKFGFDWCYRLIAVALLAIGLLMQFLPDEKKINKENYKANIIKTFSLSLAEFWRRKHAVILLILVMCYKLPDAFAGSLTTTFLLRAMHYSLSEIGVIYKFVGLFATIFGAFVAGICLKRIKIMPALMIFGILQSVSNLGFYFLSIIGASTNGLIIVVFLENFCGGLGTTALIAFIMSLCHKRFSASQFALLSALSAVGRVYISPIAGYIAENFGWPAFFITSMIFIIPFVLCWFYCSYFEMLSDSKEIFPQVGI